MEIIKLDPSQINRAAEVLATSFFDYPMFAFYFPDQKRRTRYLPWYFKNILNAALRYGAVYTTAEVSGVIFILPPGHTQISVWEYIQSGFLLTPFALGFRNYKRSMECENFVGATQVELMKNRPHYYLWGLAVEPAKKSQGALVQRSCGRFWPRPMPKEYQSISRPMMRKMFVTIKNMVLTYYILLAFQNISCQFGV